MAYTPKTWECGETITADALNHLEQGVASAGGGAEPLIVSFDHTETIEGNTYDFYDKTWQEITNALDSGRLVALKYHSLVTDVHELVPIIRTFNIGPIFGCLGLAVSDNVGGSVLTYNFAAISADQFISVQTSFS